MNLTTIITLFIIATIVLFFVVFKIGQLWAYLQYRKIPPPEPDRMRELLIGKTGTAKSQCSTDVPGNAFISGTYWKALSKSGTIDAGEVVTVIDIHDKILILQAGNNDSISYN